MASTALKTKYPSITARGGTHYVLIETTGGKTIKYQFFAGSSGDVTFEANQDSGELKSVIVTISPKGKKGHLLCWEATIDKSIPYNYSENAKLVLKDDASTGTTKITVMDPYYTMF